MWNDSSNSFFEKLIGLNWIYFKIKLKISTQIASWVGFNHQISKKLKEEGYKRVNYPWVGFSNK